MSNTPNQVPIFEGENFDYWSRQMETLFISQYLWEVVDDTYPEPPAEINGETKRENWTEAQQREYKKNLKKDASALRFIQQGLSKTIYPRIHGIKKAKQAWDILQEGFQGNEKFDTLAKKDNQVMQIFLTRVAEIVNQIRSLGDTIEEKRVVQKVLRSLPSKYDYVVAAIEESKDLSVFTFHELMSSLQVHEARMSRSSNQPLEQAFHPFMEYCKENGIQRQLTIRRSPQQNGVAERKNRTITEMARSMMIGKGLPKRFWAEAVHTAIYILNRCPTKAVRNRTPYEAWHKRKPVVAHLNIFGSIAYSHVSVENRDKFDERGEKLIFIGYSDESKAIWLRRLLVDLQQVQKQPTIVYCDNMSAILMTKNPIFHSRTKHIELQHHFIRDMIRKGEISLEFIATNDQLADFLTKTVITEKLRYTKEMLKIAN
ncbi:RNA-directed DNA polymerase [Bertholletia excelsa]